MPAPRWFWRFMYDRESAAWVRRRDETEHRALVEATVARLAAVVPTPGPVVDLGCGPGAHTLALARRGYQVTGLDLSSGMVEVARARVAGESVEAAFEPHDLGDPLPRPDASLGGALAVLVIQHLADPTGFLREVRRCLRPGGHLLITAPARGPLTVGHQSLYWRVRATFAHRLPGLIRFYDAAKLRDELEAAGLSVIECVNEPARVTALAVRPPRAPQRRR